MPPSFEAHVHSLNPDRVPVKLHNLNEFLPTGTTVLLADTIAFGFFS